jgi:hypothetical protein
VLRELVRVLELGQVQVLEQVLVLVLELGQVLALGLERGQERVRGRHRQVGSQLTTMPAGLIKFSFSSEKLLRLDVVTYPYINILC